MFFIDAAGALVSIILLAIVLPPLESVIGMQYRVLYLLAALAAPLFILSTSCYLFFPERWRAFLITVAVGNLFYCFISIAAIFWFKGDLTILGMIYFVAEVTVIAALGTVEILYSIRR
jgi:hypothetical protein